ncbi:MAG: hypothetical protein ACK46Q_08965 [Hyphomonas sp.]
MSEVITRPAPAFAQRFAAFVCAGDVITCAYGPFTVSARIVPDDCPDPPDQRRDGFWPSLNRDAPGFIGPGNNFRERFAEAQAKAEAIMAGWRRGDWFYCGVVLSVCVDDVVLVASAASLWGIEANYPETDNAYLAEIACGLLPEAVAAGQAALDRLAGLASSGEGDAP